uniref:Uncharacterized protein n=1 Tax=Lepeophtheirus salmonis TaxID=72036 RepID=A0A0K2T8F9_LEPSM
MSTSILIQSSISSNFLIYSGFRDIRNPYFHY